MFEVSAAFNNSQLPSWAEMHPELEASKTETTQERLGKVDDTTQELLPSISMLWGPRKMNQESNEPQNCSGELQMNAYVVKERPDQVHSIEQEAESLQRRNKELDDEIIELEAKFAQYTKKFENAKDEAVLRKARTEDLEQRVHELEAALLREALFGPVSETQISNRFNEICRGISNWVVTQIPREDMIKPMILGNGDPYLAILLKDEVHSREYILSSLVHQCLQKEFFGDHIILTGLSSNYTEFLQSIQICMSKPRSSERTQGRQMINFRSSVIMLMVYRAPNYQ
jgi:hypothetical protein